MLNFCPLDLDFIYFRFVDEVLQKKYVNIPDITESNENKFVLMRVCTCTGLDRHFLSIKL